MKNKRVVQKRITYIMVIISIIICIVIIGLLYMFQMQMYRKTNTFAEDLVSVVKEKYPDVENNQIDEILNSDNINHEKGEAFFDRYGISDSTISAYKSIEKQMSILKVLIVFMYIVLTVCLLLCVKFYLSYQNKKIDDITMQVKKINQKNYELEINDMSEDELSILKSELYKITVRLKEAADNSVQDKVELKEALENISHQIKTPLTSISIMIDSLVDEPDMDKEIRMEFLSDIRRETNNISFMIHNLLKLSKIESNTITFNNSEHALKDIVSESLKNVEMLRDLKDIEVINNVGDEVICCDGKWQIEAITNIIKNCYEHSAISSKIEISSSLNNVYTELKIRDYGEGISSEDLPHIFERFYRSKGSSKDSYGIGMALTKSIIDGEGGSITVNSYDDGSEFVIKYYNENIKDTF